MTKILRLLTFVAASICASVAFAQTPQPAAPSGRQPAATAPAKPETATKSDLLDVNSASKEELDALPGIGAARSEAIIKGRPYKGKDELFQKNIIPKSVYDKIKDKIIAKQK